MTSESVRKSVQIFRLSNFLWQIFPPFGYALPWVPKAFHARFPVSVKSYKVTRGFDSKTSRPAADEAPRRTREKTSGTQGSYAYTKECLKLFKVADAKLSLKR